MSLYNNISIGIANIMNCKVPTDAYFSILFYRSIIIDFGEHARSAFPIKLAIGLCRG